MQVAPALWLIKVVMGPQANLAAVLLAHRGGLAVRLDEAETEHVSAVVPVVARPTTALRQG